MKTTVETNEELGKRIKNGEDYIEIEAGSIAGKTTVKIKAAGKVAWGICFSALAIGIGLIISGAFTGGTTAVAGAVFMVPAVGVLGGSVVAGAVAIAVAGGGAGILNKLRKYEMEKKKDKIILRKKK